MNKSQSQEKHNKKILNHIYANLTWAGMLSSSIVFLVICFAILTEQAFLYPAMLGVTVGGIAGPITVILLKKKNFKKLSKTKKEINQIFSVYTNRTITWIAIILCLLILDYLIYQFNIGDAWSTDNFIFYISFSFIMTLNLYNGLGYYTAWINYRKRNNS